MRRVLYLLPLVWLAWLVMMLTHELGHVLGALATGGTVVQVVYHPAVISRTDVSPNPHPLIERWAGPIVGSVLPLIVSMVVRRPRCISAPVRFIAGFCMLANGVYLGIGLIDPVGDAHDLVVLGAPRMTLALFGIITVSIGLMMWHRVSPEISMTLRSALPGKRETVWIWIIATAWTVLAWTFGSRE